MTSIGVTVIDGATVKDVHLSFDPAEPCSRLNSALQCKLGRPDGEWVGRIERTGRRLDPELVAGEAHLLHGDVLTLVSGSSVAVAPQLRRSGSVAPLHIDLPEGRLTIGRSRSSADVAVDDPTVSKVQAVFERRGTRVTVSDGPSLNGTFVHGERVVGRRRLIAGDIVELGDHTRFEFSNPGETQVDSASVGWAQHLHYADGWLHFNRPPRQLLARPEATIPIGSAPQRPPSRRFPLPMIVLPLLIGIAIVAVSRNPMFLLFGVLGPMMAGWNWWDDRRSGRRQYEANAAKYQQRLDEAARAARQSSAALVQWREWSTPRTQALVERASSLSPELWDRHRYHDDVLDVRLGTADVPAPDRIVITEVGDADLVSKALQVRDEVATDQQSPVSCSLTTDRIVGMSGGTVEQRRALGRAVLLQIAVRNSPSEINVAVLGNEGWGWASWLPHCMPQGVRNPLVGVDPESRDRIIGYLEKIVEARAITADLHRAAPLPADHVVFIEPPFEIIPARLNAVLAAAATAGIAIVWLADQRNQLPASCALVTELGAPTTVRRTAAGAVLALNDVESVDVGVAAAVARRLAPLVDLGAGVSAAVPERAGLFDVLGADCLDPTAVVSRWRGAQPEHLRAAVGLGARGVVTLDLSNDGDGPHGLVAGTTGSGKSEFLQALVLSLAVDYSPDDVTFLFIDFKGGLTFQELVALPHTVGMIRNLDGQLALRAKRSLQAELRRRQMILHDHRAVNLSDLREKAPDVDLAALVMVIDEYAELAAKLPEFLDGVVEVALTGRALGIHLLLATQSPGGSVSKSIQHCVKYRISFRLKDSAESREVLGPGPDSSKLVNRPGRGLLCDGDGRFHEFQAAWAGGRSDVDDVRRASANTLYRPRSAPGSAAKSESDLTRVIASVCEAARQLAVAPPRRPWLESLPLSVSLDRLPAVEAGELETQSPYAARLGIIDLPDEQRQPAYVWDTAVAQNLLVLGDGGTGKTTVLRTIAASFSEAMTPDAVRIVGLDAVGGALGGIDALPNTLAVVKASEPSRIRRVIAYLRRVVNERRVIVGKAGSLSTHRQTGGAPIPDLIVLVDGLDHLLSNLEVLDGGVHHADFIQLVSDGPAMGVHFAMTTDQPQRVPMSIGNAVPERLVLRTANKDASYAAWASGDLAMLPNGRALSTRNRAEVQIAVVGDGESVDGLRQTEWLADVGARLRQRREGSETTLTLDPPDVLRPQDLPALELSRGQVVLGIDDLHLQPQVVDLGVMPTFIVMGPDLSGRSSVVEWIRSSLNAQDSVASRAVLVAGRGAPPLRPELWSHVCLEPVSAVEVLERLVEQIKVEGSAGGPLLVAVDDGDELLESPIGAPAEEAQLHRRFAAAMDALVRAGRGATVTVVLAGRLNALTRASGWAQRMRQNQQALILAPPTLAITVTDPVFNVTLPRRSDYVARPGTGVLLRRGRADVIQLVHP